MNLMKVTICTVLGTDLHLGGMATASDAARFASALPAFVYWKPLSKMW